MDDNFFTEKELKSANRGSIAPVVVVIFVIIALLGLAFFGGKYYLASRNNIKIFIFVSNTHKTKIQWITFFIAYATARIPNTAII